MSVTSANLVGYLRAEFAKAARLRLWLLSLQLAAAMPGAISVVVPDDAKKVLYALAIMGAALLCFWWLTNTQYRAKQSAAQAARRAVLLLGGLGQPFSPSEVQSLRERFTVSAAEAQAQEKADYYASTLPPGPARLGEMLEESALYSQRLHQISAKIMLGIICIFFLGALVILLAATPYVARDTAFVVVRIFLATLVFVMSADVLGAYRAHDVASKEIGDVRRRLMIADRGKYPLPDVLLAMTDYNAAIEGAPEILPFAYKFQAGRLDQAWKDYQSDRAAARTPP